LSRACLNVCIVGGGPRGLSVLERICANERKSASHPAVTVHIVEPFRPGSGRVWRTGQPRELLMNTVASQVTVYTDDSVELEGPVEPGPSLYEWARSLAARSAPEAVLGDYDDATTAEAAALGPDSYPTRALYGRYLEDAFERVVAEAPGHLGVQVHRSRAVALNEAGEPLGGRQQLLLADGTRLPGLDAVVLAQGHVPTTEVGRLARQAEAHGLTYIPPANPADVDLAGIRPGQQVLVRGLGLNFFDHLALLTLGRGGVFERRGGRLAYQPSGREPRIHAGSRRGVPHSARGENEKGAYGRHIPRVLTPETIGRLTAQRGNGQGLSFGADLWPLITREVESVYYRTLLAAQGREAAGRELADRYLAAPDDGARAAALDSSGVDTADRWDWERISRPCHRRAFADPADFRRWLLDYLAEDVRQARAGNVSGPLKAAADVMRDLRNEIRLVVDHAGLDGDSHRDDLDGWYTRLNAFLSIGPPLSRIEEMAALIEAGVLRVIGPETTIRVDVREPAFVAESAAVPGTGARASVLIEARLPEPDLRTTADPLLRQLLDSGQCRTFRIPAACGRDYETGGVDVTRRPYRLVDARGRAHPRRFAYGIPTESVHWVTAAGVRPGVNSVTLGDADAIARAVLALHPAVPPEAPDRDSDPVQVTA